MIHFHRNILTYMPLAGFAVYAILTGFDNPLFLPIFLTGWIVLVVYQTILTAIYTPPAYPGFATILTVFFPVLLFSNAVLQQQTIALVFIETAAIDLMAIILALIAAFIFKLMREGSSNAPLFAIVFTIGLFATAGFFLGKLLYTFFKEDDFNALTMLIFGIALLQSTLFFSFRMAKLTSRIGSGSAPKQEFSATAILVTLGLWFLVIPLLMWVGSWFYRI